MLWLDLETQSQCDLIKHGLTRYAQDLTTQVICMSWAFDEEDVQTWFAEDDQFPKVVIDYIENETGPLSAHNASFERHLFDFVLSNDYNFKPPALERWQCTSARAMAHGLPPSLMNICKALNLPVQKQASGRRLITTYSTPGFLTEWQDDDKALMQEYCEMDVITMRAFCSLLRELTPEEWNQYYITERMNDVGVPIDLPFVTSALLYATDIKEDVSAQILLLTDKMVEKATQRKTRDVWLKENLSQELVDSITVEKDDIKKIKFDKNYRNSLAAHKDCPDKVRKFVDLVDQAGGATISKYSAMANTNVDGRVHGSLIWNGAGATGRFSSRGLQLQNFRRDVFDDPEEMIARINVNVPVERPAETLGRLIRSAITSPHKLTYSDYSQIEARVLPWLTDNALAEKTLDIFREGRDLYSENAIGMFNLQSIDDVTKDLRQAAKQGVLACGFGGGGRAVKAMASGYGLMYDDEKADGICQSWRTANPWARPFWYGLKDAAKEAMRYPNTISSHGKLSFLYDGKDWLWMMLPSGRCLAYFKPKFELVEYPWGDEGWEIKCLWGSGKPKAGEKWPRRVLNHLILSENATQATAADIMRETIVRAYNAGFDLLFSVHDELVVEGECKEALHEIMLQPPTWAAGLPIAAETDVNLRYGK